MTVVETARFPYGTFQVASELQERYTTAYSQATSYPLAPDLPLHHPLLESLSGTSPLQDAPMPWWPEYVAESAPECAKQFLLTLTASEFRSGCIEQARWKAFTLSLSQEERSLLPRSPKLAPLLENTPWFDWFVDRGPDTTPVTLDLIISTRPEYFLNMSNGQGWKSCQHLRYGEYNTLLPGNFYDTGVAIAMLVPSGASVWDEKIVLARTTLRIFDQRDTPLVAIGRVYHNNLTLASLLLRTLVDRCERHTIPCGFLADTNAAHWLTDGCLGNLLQERTCHTETLRSFPFWKPEDFRVPYVDGDFHWHTESSVGDTEPWIRLSASVTPLRATMAAPRHL